ncbi:MAG: hypothetical protein JNK21_03835 [Rhodospirillaceae bacterium]|nr:hypothetical protein [Rhodospirillaceae bacterium]
MTALLQRYYRKPFIGIFAFVAVFLGTPLAHSVTVLIIDAVGKDNSYMVFLTLGAAAVGLLLYGTRKNDEVIGTTFGYVAGVLLWIGWASYSFKFHEFSLDLPMIARDETGSKLPMHLLFIQSSFGICVVTLLFFVFNKDSRCNAFRWIQRVCGLKVGEPDSGIGRNYCRITFLETVYVIWFCYSVSLFLGDGRFLGYNHPVTYAIVGLLAVWGVYLLYRLMKFTRVMAGIRYAIPTKSIFWIPFGEFAPKYGFYEEVWLHPAEYSGTMWAVLAVFVALIVGSGFLPQRRQAPAKA